MPFKKTDDWLDDLIEFQSNPEKELKEKIIKVTNEILDSFEGELKKHILNTAYLAGGCFYSLAHKKKPKDYDFYFMSKDAVDKFGKLFSNTKSEISIISDTDNSITIQLKNYTIQFIVGFYGSPEEVTRSFDFAHTKCYYVPKTKDFYTSYNVWEPELVFNHLSPYPVNALKRLIKFTQRGHTVSDKELFKLAIVLSNTPMQTEDQLIYQAKDLYGGPTNLDLNKTFLKKWLKIGTEVKEKHFKNKLERLIEE